MRLADFIDELLEAGWRPTLDTQYEEIEKLYRRLWPVIAELEDDLAGF